MSYVAFVFYCVATVIGGQIVDFEYCNSVRGPSSFASLGECRREASTAQAAVTQRLIAMYSSPVWSGFACVEDASKGS